MKAWQVIEVTLSLFVVVLGGAGPARAEQPLDVWVSIQPQQYLVDHIGGDRVTSHVLVGPAESPATFDPTPLQMARLHDADLFISAGVPFERTLIRKLRSTIPDLVIANGIRGLDLKTMSGEEALTTGRRSTNHNHDHHTDNHSHGPSDVDPHFWMDPLLFADHAAVIAENLCTHAPDNCSVFSSNLERLRSQLIALDQRLSAMLAPFRGRTILVYHPAYNYFTRRYGLKTAVVEVEGKEPEARALVQIVETARRLDITTVFVQPQFSSSRARTLAQAIDGDIVALDPLALDYIENLEDIGRRIAKALQP